MTRVAALIGAIVVIVACGSTAGVPPADAKLALGQWGGDSGAMIVSDTAMHLHINCTYGDVSGRIALRSDGTFDVAGSYLLRAFPIAVGPPMPARFTGRVNGSSATVTVTVTDTLQRATVVRGPVIVTFRREPRLMPCPVCQRPIVTQISRFGARD
jgi:hypothetical protein